MKATELRLGNLVLYNNEQTHIINGYDIADLDIDPIEDSFTPIPLTEEWLLKFGFEKNDWKEIGKLFYYGWAKDSFLIESTRDNTFFCLDGKPETVIKYVHQLQNLYFALTGEELKINQ